MLKALCAFLEPQKPQDGECAWLCPRSPQSLTAPPGSVVNLCKITVTHSRMEWGGSIAAISNVRGGGPSPVPGPSLSSFHGHPNWALDHASWIESEGSVEGNLRKEEMLCLADLISAGRGWGVAAPDSQAKGRASSDAP